MSVMLIDLDNFKSINDRFGHETGDKVIICAAHLAEQTLRQNDQVFRLGGEEFVCLMPATSSSQATVIAERLRKSFQEAAAEIAGHPVQATLSIGIASMQAGEGSIDQLLSRSDSALYEAKRGGRNRVVASELVVEFR